VIYIFGKIKVSIKDEKTSFLPLRTEVDCTLIYLINLFALTFFMKGSMHCSRQVFWLAFILLSATFPTRKCQWL